MYAENVSKVLMDVTTPQKLVKRVLRDNDMQIVRNFSPVESEYKFELNGNKRITMSLTKDEFVQKEEKNVRGGWHPSVEMRVRGTSEFLEDTMIRSIENIMELGERFKRFKIIK